MSWATIGGAVGTAFGGPIGGAIGGVAGGLLDRNQSKDDSQQSQIWSAESQAKQMDFQREMSNTSWQRGVADMKAAGLNPMLAYSQGGASSPGGSAFTASQTRPIGSFDASSANVVAQNKVLETQAEKNAAEAASIRDTTPVNIDRMRTDMDRMRKEIEKMDTDIKVGEASAAEIAARTQKAIAELPLITANINHLKSLVNLNNAQIMDLAEGSALKRAQYGEIIQRTKQNLPELEALSKQLDNIKKRFDEPRWRQESQLHANELTGFMAAAIKLLGKIFGGK